MPRYAFTGAYDEFPAVRALIEQSGIVIVSTSTDEGVIHVETESAIEEAKLILAEG